MSQSEFAKDPAKYVSKEEIAALKSKIEEALKALRAARESFEKFADTSKLESMLTEALEEISGWG